jgi:hypothetical protein
VTELASRPVEAHYEELLGARYTWMMGGSAACHSNAKALLDAAGIVAREESIALDLGAGAGFHARALAKRGFEIITPQPCNSKRGRRWRVPATGVGGYFGSCPGLGSSMGNVRASVDARGPPAGP